MFGYLSFADLSVVIRDNIQRIPSSVDLVVGIPRSGMIPAYMVGLYMNRHVMDLESYLAGYSLGHGRTRAVGKQLDSAASARHILLVDDSASSGTSILRSRDRILAAGFTGKVTTCAVVVVPSAGGAVDLFFKEMPQPRVFEWNAFHHPELANSCFDIDGLLCVDPTPTQNDDGVRYQEFLRTAQPLFRPTLHIGYVVSSRLEKYRALTEGWLRANDISFGSLHLLDLPTQEERQRQGAHAKHKARVYRDTGALLFYESEPAQSAEIARLSGKPVLCTADMTLHLPDGLHAGAIMRNASWTIRRPLGRIKGWVRRRMPKQPNAFGR